LRAALRAQGERGRPSIRIVAFIIALALLWYASLRAAAVSRGAISVVAKGAFLLLTSLACIAIGFLLPAVPVVSAIIGSAFWAGLLATAGAFAGMGLSDVILTRLETRQARAAPTTPGEKTRPTV
jgi:heme A synthase